MAVDELIELGKDILFPRRCPVCDEVMVFRSGLICKTCKPRVIPVRQPFCACCGKPLISSEAELCKICMVESRAFDKARAAVIYNDAAARIILDMKDNNKRENTDFIAECIIERLSKELKMFGAEGIIPVPLDEDAYMRRGFNQSELIALKLSKYLHIPIYNSVVKRLKAAKQQKSLDLNGRRKNLKRSFIIQKNDVKLKRVILVDDVYTTGCTADELSSVLKSKGVNSVMVVTFATGVPK
ncbi:MAG: ComF family protein [Lachnospiraceae bacterium]|nr:ComF family protein [Lachnospiraceae bacterium]